MAHSGDLNGNLLNFKIHSDTRSSDNSSEKYHDKSQLLSTGWTHGKEIGQL